MRPYKCVTCAEPHKPSECTKPDRNTPHYVNDHIQPTVKAAKYIEKYLKEKLKTNPFYIALNIITRPYLIQALITRNYLHETSTRTQQPGNKRYADTVKTSNETNTDKEIPSFTTKWSLEEILIKQSEKLDHKDLQQMSSLMQLVVKLINKLV